MRVVEGLAWQLPATAPSHSLDCASCKAGAAGPPPRHATHQAHRARAQETMQKTDGVTSTLLPPPASALFRGRWPGPPLLMLACRTPFCASTCPSSSLMRSSRTCGTTTRMIASISGAGHGAHTTHVAKVGLACCACEQMWPMGLANSTPRPARWPRTRTTWCSAHAAQWQ